MGNKFNALHRDLRDDDYRLASETRQFEEARLRWIMSRFKLTKFIPAVIHNYEQRTGLRDLRFSAFNDCFPTFPFLLGANLLRHMPVPWGRKPDGELFRTPTDYQVHRDDHSTEPARFKKFSWVPFYVAYAAFYSAVAGNAGARRIALVYPRKGFANGMVIHNDETEEYYPSGLCWMYKFGETGKRLYVQPFSALIEAVYSQGRGWRPTGKPPTMTDAV